MSLARNRNRKRTSIANKLYKLSPGKLNPIDLSINQHPSWMTRAYRNNRYIVMIDDNSKTTKGIAIKAMVQTLDDTPIVNHWSELQKIKNELFGEETTGIEYYPKESKLINDHNIYWLWIFSEEVLPVPIIK